MADDRTTEEITADQALEAALVNCARARGQADDKFLSCYIAVAAFQDMTDPVRTEYVIAMTNGAMPAHLCFGLLDVGQGLIEDMT